MINVILVEPGDFNQLYEIVLHSSRRVNVMMSCGYHNLCNHCLPCIQLQMNVKCCYSIGPSDPRSHSHASAEGRLAPGSNCQFAILSVALTLIYLTILDRQCSSATRPAVAVCALAVYSGHTTRLAADRRTLPRLPAASTHTRVATC